ncbi:hypothetical protein HYFRA_00010173 [Hymenoscyphus fraxineus]|uniref:Heterokaryon incompatibility domain-containing protein n=1 Tax=Hymenoscyphus fraxineus TaxID=746836 RepID=A0A9N9KTY7_9HELO|nr:hypothetical protein HYFRA_00010173 [Hymenoscyphus fraxineus]
MTVIKQIVSKRSALIKIHENCPHRAYVELEVPRDAKVATCIVFKVTSRDQGWADDMTGPSYTWFDASVDRPGGRSNLRTLTVCNNRIGKEFYEQQYQWDSESGPRRQNWLNALRAGDVIKLVPKAAYLAWVNIIQEASITLEYEQLDEFPNLTSSMVTSTSNKDHYTSEIRHSHRKIRILVLKPGKSEDPVHGYFSHTELSDDSGPSNDFIALSYCWGDQADRSEIHIQPNPHESNSAVTKRPFSVTRSAETALRRLRSTVEFVNVWIDAVCINQDDHEERAQQLSIMGLIYSQAGTVHIWLGEDNNRGIENALRVVRDIYNFNCGSCMGGDECSCAGIAHTLKREDIEARSTERGEVSFRSMYEVFELHQRNFTPEVIDECGGYNNVQLSGLMTVLFENPWFTRVWVVQEALLSAEAYVRYGDEMISWEEVVTINDWLSDPVFAGQQRHIKWQTVMVPVWKSLTGIHQKRSEKRVDISPENGSVVEYGKLSGILDVFHDALDLKATDPRDRLYALLAFGDETRTPSTLDKLVKPDYDKSLGHVFADFTRWWIREHRSLAILSSIHCQPTRTWQRTSDQSTTSSDTPTLQSLNQPTWAISTEGHSRWATANLESQFNFKATGSNVPSLELLDGTDPFKLLLKGVKVSDVKALGHVPIGRVYPYREDDAFRGDGIPGVFDRLMEPCGFSGFWSTGTNGLEQDRNVQRGQENYWDHVRAHWNYYPGEKLRALLPSQDNGFKYYETVKVPTCLHECFFVASNGLSGLCPPMAKEGDLIVLLYGGNVPYLIRSREGDTFEFVGECFVDGMMKGEYLERLEQDDRGAEVFCLV